MERVFLHYDMDAFFASVEQRDNIKYRNIPIAVGYGVITTASYEARKYGIKSGMNAVEARMKCPHLKFVGARKHVYEKVGKRIQKLVRKVTDKCEFASIDEGYIEITDIIKEYSSVELFIKRFKDYIYKNTRLTCSVGIGYNKVSAKIASDINKPNGYYIFRDRESFLEYVRDKELSIIPGIGKKTREILTKYGITRVSDLYRIEKAELKDKFGEIRGNYLYEVIRGNYYSNIESDRKTHSYGYEITFKQTMNDEITILENIKNQVDRLCERLAKKNEYAKTIVIKIRYSNFTTYTKSKTIDIATRDKQIIYKIAKENYMKMYKRDDVRLIGVHLGSITKSNLVQLTFDDMLKWQEDK